MCLYYTEKETQRIEDLLKKSSTKSLVFWKIFVINDWRNQTGQGRSLKSICFPGKPIKPGYFVSDRKVKNMTITEMECKIVDNGIHVFTTKPTSIYYVKPYYAVVQVTCHLDDFVAASSDGEAVFAKVKIDKRDLDKAKK